MSELHHIGRFGLASRRDYARTAVGALPVLAAGGALLARLGTGERRDALHRAERRWSNLALRRLDIELDLEGCHHIDPTERYVIAPLHEGFLDPVVLFQLGLPMRFVARDELFDWKRLGRYLRNTGQIVVPTQPSLPAYRALIEGARTAFAADESLVMFPQGSILGIEVAFRKGPLRIARRFNRPILPVVITGTHTVWEHPYSSRLRYGQRVSVSVMPPLPAGQAEASWRELEREMKSIALGSGMASARRYVPQRDGWWDGYDFEIDPDFVDVARQMNAHRAGLGRAHPNAARGNDQRA
jgi:1-acyl-sn-glycerol-3-phosphate acyltransferase